MAQTLNVLSIDFDFFQEVDPEIMALLYPDGIDQPTDIATLIWFSKYANSYTRKEILSAKPKINEIAELKDIIKISSKNRKPISVIANSHVNIYDTIIERTYNFPEFTHVQLYNIDMHHDMFNHNFTLDCGNWIEHLSEDLIKTNITLQHKWIINPASENLYELTDPEFQDIIEKNFECLKDKTWDIIFLCRSDIWLPPHLDHHFTDLANFIIAHSEDHDVEEEILIPRYDENFISQYQAFDKQQNSRKELAYVSK